MIMFGHLKAEDFTNLLEGATLKDRRQAHLSSCAQCRQKFESLQEVRLQVDEMRMDNDEYIPEPDWSEFRSDVRNALLSRSVRRENSGRSWLGGSTWKPALAWGVSMLLVFAISAGVVWNQRGTISESTEITGTENLSSSEEADLSSLAAMSQSDIFDDLVHLNADEAQSLLMILDDMAQDGVSQQ
ncbi:MAG TPA: hypothetical protein VMT78_08485 [Terriglobia bacterium]|nr:hypothetical protein [Terriglobia bacterium]